MYRKDSAWRWRGRGRVHFLGDRGGGSTDGILYLDVLCLIMPESCVCTHTTHTHILRHTPHTVPLTAERWKNTFTSVCPCVVHYTKNKPKKWNMAVLNWFWETKPLYYHSIYLWYILLTILNEDDVFWDPCPFFSPLTNKHTYTCAQTGTEWDWV